MRYYEIPSPRAPQNEESYIARVDREERERQKEAEPTETPIPTETPDTPDPTPATNP